MSIKPMKIVEDWKSNTDMWEGDTMVEHGGHRVLKHIKFFFIQDVNPQNQKFINGDRNFKDTGYIIIL